MGLQVGVLEDIGCLHREAYVGGKIGQII